MRRILKVVEHDGYEIRTEEVTGECPGPPIVIDSAYATDGLYLGPPELAKFLTEKMHLTQFQRSRLEHTVASIAFSEKKQQWYGWSHRAIMGFGIGDALFEEDIPWGTEKTPFKEHGYVPCQTLEDAKEAAANFACYVS